MHPMVSIILFFKVVRTLFIYIVLVRQLLYIYSMQGDLRAVKLYKVQTFH